MKFFYLLASIPIQVWHKQYLCNQPLTHRYPYICSVQNRQPLKNTQHNMFFLNHWNLKTSFLKRTLAAIPGKTRRKSGRNLRSEARTQPAFAWLMFFAESVLWTITLGKVLSKFSRAFKTSTLGTWRPIVFNVLRCMNND